jgi:4-hydroxy-tetrahydrodipicolinate synthase
MNALDQPVGSPREPLLPFSEAQTAKVAAILAEARVADVIRSLA